MKRSRTIDIAVGIAVIVSAGCSGRNADSGSDRIATTTDQRGGGVGRGGNDQASPPPLLMPGSDDRFHPGPGRVTASRVPATRPLPTTYTIESPAPAASPRAPSPRDLGNELRSALGTLAGCAGGTGANVPTQVSVSISGTVMPTGSISRASVSGAGLDSSAIACIQQRVLSTRLAPVTDGPRFASTTITLLRQAVTP